MKRKLNRRTVVLLVSLTVLLMAAVGGTLAYIIANSGPITNTFTPSKVDCAVVDVSDDSNYTYGVENTGNTNAYFRVAIVVTWKNAGNGNVYAQKPVLGTDYRLTINEAVDAGEYWFEAGGYYYFNSQVAPGAIANLLSYSLEEGATVPDGYTLSVEIVASAIQATSDAVAAWSDAVIAITDGAPLETVTAAGTN